MSITFFKIGGTIFEVDFDDNFSYIKGKFKLARYTTADSYGITISKKIVRSNGLPYFITLGDIYFYRSCITVLISYDTTADWVDRKLTFKKNKKNFYDITECLLSELELEDFVE